MKKISILLLLTFFTYGSEKQLQKSKAELRQERKEKKAKNEKYAWEIRQHCFDLNKRSPHEDEEVFSTLRILFEAIDEAVDEVMGSPLSPKHNSSAIDGGGGLPLKKNAPSLHSKRYKLKQLIILIVFLINNTVGKKSYKGLPTEDESSSPLTIAFLAEMIQQLFEEDEIVEHLIPPTNLQQLHPVENPEINN